jgi:hypothetical protein
MQIGLLVVQASPFAGRDSMLRLARDIRLALE